MKECLAKAFFTTCVNIFTMTKEKLKHITYPVIKYNEIQLILSYPFLLS